MNDGFNERVDELLRAIESNRPTDPHAYVGTLERPPRVVTVGRRRADRWLVRTSFAVFFFLIVFVLWTSYQQWVRQEALVRQEHELRCFAVATQTYEIAVGDVVVELKNSTAEDSPDLIAAKARLRVVQDQLRRARDAQDDDPERCPGEE